MRLPDFLIIGAMKAGTTTLYHDLLTNRQVFFPLDKEPGNLASDDVLSEDGLGRYASIFKATRPDQICGEASTTYTKLPDIGGVPERAVTVLGTRLRVIYVVREPVSRIISHHYHEYAEGKMGPDVNQAVRDHDRLINYSRYAMQIEPWLDRLGLDHVRIIRLESYIKNRRSTVGSLCQFLGIEARPELVQANQTFNPSDNKPAPAGLLWRMSKTSWYRKAIRPLLTMSLKSRIRALLPRVPHRPAPPMLQTVDYILDRVGEDAQQLQHLMGRAQPLWDFDSVRRTFLDRDLGSPLQRDGQ